MKKTTVIYTLIFVAFGLLMISTDRSDATYTILRDAGSLTRGKLDSDRLQCGSSVTCQGDLISFSTVASGLSSLQESVVSTRTAFYNYTSTADAQNALFNNYNTTANVKDVAVGVDTTTLRTETGTSTSTLRTEINASTDAINGRLTGGAITFYDEGTVAGNATTVNCVGNNIACSQSGSTTTVTISGAGSWIGLAATDLDMSTFSIKRVKQLQLQPTTYFDAQQYLIPLGTGSFAYDVTARSLLVSTDSKKASWVSFAGLGEIDVTSAAVARFKMDKSADGHTYDSVVATRMARNYGGTFLSTGINNTSAWSNSNSTFSLSIQKESWMSPHQGNFTTGQMSVSVWIFWRNAATVDRHIVNKYGPDGTSYEWTLFYRVAGTGIRGSLNVSDGGAISVIDSTSGVMNLNQWNHIVWVLDKTQADGSKSKIYVNNNLGSNSSTDTNGTSSETNCPITIGTNGQSPANLYTDAMIDDFEFYDRPLTAQEVAALFNKRKP